MRKKKTVLTVVLALVLAAVAVAGGFVYKTRYRPTEILADASPDGVHTFCVCMLGEPDFPFGAAHCRIDVTEGSRTVIRYRFDVANDGKIPDESNFFFCWCDDSLSFDISGEEMDTMFCSFGFDGDIDTGRLH